ncbi:MAG: acylneuraminate cytidylyltransferase family protein [Verrucomicrobiae bacterium]|nr:acylneuraminate cytidylyltransferase family protein [Verrucomicrobiae bacterium]
MEVLAIIPARGGSKGVPRKNLRPVGGRSLLATCVASARGATLVSRVCVSTDDDEIAAAAIAAGAEVVRRPAEISGDAASSESALLHALSALEAAEGYRPDILAFLQCTSPFVMPEDVDGAIALVADGRADSALTAFRSDLFLWRLDEGAGAVGINHDKSRRPLRQERSPEFAENGAVYAMRVPGFVEARHRFFGKTLIHEMPRERSLEIDAEEDLTLANALFLAMGLG